MDQEQKHCIFIALYIYHNKLNPNLICLFQSNTLSNSSTTSSLLSFEDLNTIHLARWLVIDYEKLDEMPKLVYSANFDNSSTSL